MSPSIKEQKHREMELEKSALNTVMEPAHRIDESLNQDLIKKAKENERSAKLYNSLQQKNSAWKSKCWLYLPNYWSSKKKQQVCWSA